eukprot:4116937-Karenia_brevis.AAC.1
MENAADKLEVLELRQQLLDMRMEMARMGDITKLEAEVQKLREDCGQLQLSQVPDSVLEQVRAKEAELVAKAKQVK